MSVKYSGCLATAALLLGGCSSVPSSPSVLRIDYVGHTDANPQSESGVIFVLPGNLKPSMLPPDLKQRMVDSFPIEYLYGGRLANTCYTSSNLSGMSILKGKSRSNYSGDLWRVADAGWHIDLTLQTDGTISGSSEHWYATLGGDYSSKIVGSYRYVSDISECFDYMRKGGT